MDQAASVASTTSWTLWGGISRVLVGAVFLVAAAGKIHDPLTFADQIRQFQMVPDHITNAMAFLLPWLEAVCAALLITGIWRREARVIVAGMILVFLAAKIWAEAFDLKITCGCFGSWLKAFDKATEGVPGILLNIGLFAGLIVDWFADRLAPRRSVEPAA